MSSTRRFLGLQPVQVAGLLGAAAVLLWSVPGLVLNPDFSTGQSATTVRVLGVDMNGWHAVSGFLVAVPCLLVLRRPRLEAAVVAASAAGLLATALWAALTSRPFGGLFYFRDQGADVLLHVVVAGIFIAGAVSYVARARSPAQ